MAMVMLLRVASRSYERDVAAHRPWQSSCLTSLENLRVWTPDGKTVYNGGIVAAMVVMYHLLGVAVAGSCMWRLLSLVASFPCSLDLRFEHAADTSNCTAAAH